MRVALAAVPVLWSLACSPTQPEVVTNANASVDFQAQVRPLLAERCFGCHGADGARRAAGLRLDRAEAVFAARPNGGAPVIVRGDAAGSLLVQRIQMTDARRMPPPSAGP